MDGISFHRRRILFFVLGTIVLGFVFLTLMVTANEVSHIDLLFSREVQERQRPFLNALMKFVSFFGYMPYSLFTVVITSAVFFGFKFKKEALFILFSLLSGVVSWSTKLLFARPRPTEDLVKVLVEVKNNSFPSGHVLFYVAFFGFITLLMYHLKSIARPLRIALSIVCFFMIFSVPLSRVYLGAHWFTDVVGGFLLGILCLLILSYFYLRKSRKISER